MGARFHGLEAVLQQNGQPCTTREQAQAACEALGWTLDGHPVHDPANGSWLVGIDEDDAIVLDTDEYIDRWRSTANGGSVSGVIEWDRGLLPSLFTID